MSPHPRMHGHRHAFTLVELSIVLVILGLLVGGVLSGQSLIRAAELRTVSTDFDKYRTAMGAFRDKYFGLPGDITNATSFWGTVSGDCMTVPGTGTQTCNGNGNGLIFQEGNDNRTELFRSWQQLANAGLITGKYSNIGGADSDVIPGENVPRSKIANAGWSFVGIPTINAARPFTGNSLFLGAWNDYEFLDLPVLKPSDAYNIDRKIDDGFPHSGKVVTPRYAEIANCRTSADNVYALDNQTITCYLIMHTGY